MKLEKFIATIDYLFVKNRGKPYEEKAAYVSTDDNQYFEIVFGKHSIAWSSLNDGDEIMINAHISGKKWKKPNGETIAITNIVVDDCTPLRCDEESVAWAYKTLGVSPECSADEIKTAYRNMMQTVHPDKFMSIETSVQFKEELNKIAGNVSRAFNIIRQIKN